MGEKNKESQAKEINVKRMYFTEGGQIPIFVLDDAVGTIKRPYFLNNIRLCWMSDIEMEETKKEIEKQKQKLLTEKKIIGLNGKELKTKK